MLAQTGTQKSLTRETSQLPRSWSKRLACDSANARTVSGMDWSNSQVHCEREFTEKKAFQMLSSFDTSQLPTAWLNTRALANMSHIDVTWDTSHLDMSPVKLCASQNMPRMLTTFDVFQALMFGLRLCLLMSQPLHSDSTSSSEPQNRHDMSVTAEVSQVLMSPCWASALARSPMAARSSALSAGANAARVVEACSAASTGRPAQVTAGEHG